MPIPGTPGSPVRITVFPEWPEALLVLVDEDAEGVLVLPPLPVPFDRAGVAEVAREAGFGGSPLPIVDQSIASRSFFAWVA
jgi:hypothetical protein